MTLSITNGSMGLTLGRGRSGGGGVTPPAATPKLFAFIGASNTRGLATFDGGDPWPSNTYEWDGTALTDISGTSDPIGSADAGTMAFSLQFAIDYRAANPTGDIVVFSNARTGAGFSNNRWSVGDDLYNELITDCNAYLSANPTGELAGIISLMGAADAADQAEADGYAATQDAMVAGFRAGITGASDVPVVFLGTTSAMAGGYRYGGMLRSAQEIAYQRQINMGYASTQEATFFDAVHFDAAGQRLVGGNAATVFNAGVSNTVTTPAGTPAVVSATVLTFSTDSGATATFSGSVTVASGNALYLAFAHRNGGETLSVVCNGVEGVAVYNQTDYSKADNREDGVAIYRFDGLDTSSLSITLTRNHTTGVLRTGCCAIVVSGGTRDTILAESNFGVNNTAVTVTETFTASKSNVIFSIGCMNVGTAFNGFTHDTTIVEGGIDPGNSQNRWYVAYSTNATSGSPSESVTFNFGNNGGQYGTVAASVMVE